MKFNYNQLQSYKNANLVMLGLPTLAARQNEYKKNKDVYQQIEEKFGYNSRDLNLKATAHNKRAEMKGVPGRIQKISLAKWFASQDLYCKLCGGLLGRDVSIDHIIPLSKGGDHAISNLQLVHWHCNTKKSASVLERQGWPSAPEVMVKTGY